MEGIQVTRNHRDVIIVPPEPRNPLPTAHLGFQADPIRGEFLVTPMNFSAVTRDAMRRIQQLTACISFFRLCIGASGIYQPGEQYRKHPFWSHVTLYRYRESFSAGTCSSVDINPGLINRRHRPV